MMATLLKDDMRIRKNQFSVLNIASKEINVIFLKVANIDLILLRDITSPLRGAKPQTTNSLSNQVAEYLDT